MSGVNFDLEDDDGLPTFFKVPTLPPVDVEGTPLPGFAFLKIEKSPAFYGNFLVPDVVRRTTPVATVVGITLRGSENGVVPKVNDVVLVPDYVGRPLPPLRGWDPESTYKLVEIKDITAIVRMEVGV